MIDTDALLSRCDLPAIVASYTPLTKRGREWVGRCVAHSPDNHPSMYVYQKGGKWMVHCFSCDFSADAIGFIQQVQEPDFLKACEYLGADHDWKPTLQEHRVVTDTPRITSKPPAGTEQPDMTLRALGSPKRVWTYHDSDGAALGYVARYDTKDNGAERGKEYRPWTWGARDGEQPQWAVGQWNKPRPLYGLDRLAARPDAPVIVTEGEASADAASRLLTGMVAVTWPGGARAVHHADWNALKGRKVLLWPDADEPGLKAMRQLAGVLADPTGLGCKVRLLDPTGQPDGWDVSDAETEGWSSQAVKDWALARITDYEPPSVKKPDTATDTAPETVQDALQATESGAEPPPAADTPSEPSPKPVPRARKARPVLTVVGGAATAPALDPDPLPQPLTEACLADEFAALHEDKFRYVPEWNKWLVWTGNRWKVEVRRTTAMQDVRPLCFGLKYRPEAAAMTPASKARFEAKKYIVSVLDLAESDVRLVARPDQFDADPMLLNTPAGTVDLRDGTMRSADPLDLITRQTSIAPELGPTPLFDRVLASAHGDNEAMRAYLWRWLGYLLTGDTREECFLFLFGKPRSGKTTLVEAIAAIMGSVDDGGYATKADIDLFTESKRDLAGRLHILYGCRFAHAAETEEGRHWKPSLLKEATGGDTMAGERKYENRFTFRPTHKLLVHGNYRPHMRAVDEGLRRRLHLLEYCSAVTEAERDNTLKARLVAEYPAILHRMIQGCLDWQRQGLNTPPEIHANVSSYFESEDSFGSWLEEKTEAKRGARVASGAAYRSFSEYVAERGEHPPPHKRFTMMLQQRGFDVSKSGTRYIIGMELKLPDLPPLTDDDFR